MWLWLFTDCELKDCGFLQEKADANLPLKHTKCSLALNPYTQVHQLSRSEWHKVEVSKEIVNHM